MKPKKKKHRNPFAIPAKNRKGGAMRNKKDKRSSNKKNEKIKIDE